MSSTFPGARESPGCLCSYQRQQPAGRHIQGQSMPSWAAVAWSTRKVSQGALKVQLLTWSVCLMPCLTHHTSRNSAASQMLDSGSMTLAGAIAAAQPCRGPRVMQSFCPDLSCTWLHGCTVGVMQCCGALRQHTSNPARAACIPQQTYVG